jgi:predicted PurR-regulated permease PerM
MFGTVIEEPEFVVEPVPLAAASHALHVRTVALSVIVAAAALLVLHEAKPVVVPVLVSVLCAYALEPSVAALLRWRVPRPLAVIIIYTLLPAGAVSTAQAVKTRFNRFAETLPTMIAEAQADATPDAGGAPSPLDRPQQTAKTIQQAAAEHAPHPRPASRASLSSGRDSTYART